jgi:hypothetical protein
MYKPPEDGLVKVETYVGVEERIKRENMVHFVGV